MTTYWHWSGFWKPMRMSSHTYGLDQPALRLAVLGSMGCFWPTRWCWTVAGQLAHRCCRCPWRGLHLEMPASAPGCMGPHIDCWGMAQHGVAGRWALTRAARWSSLPRYDLALDQQHHPPGSLDWYLDEMEGFGLAGLLREMEKQQDNENQIG